MQERIKSHKRYIFYRVYCIIAIAVWNIVGFWMMFHKMTPQYILPMIPLILPAIFLVFDFAISPFKFSVFGMYEKTSFPQEGPLFTQKYSWGQIGWFHASIPFFSWYVFPSGLGISIVGSGKTFIQIDNIVAVRKYFLQGYKLTHNSPELRNPVILPTKRVFEALQDVAQRHGRFLNLQ